MAHVNAAHLNRWELPRRSQNHQYNAALMAQVSAMLMTAPSTPSSHTKGITVAKLSAALKTFASASARTSL